MFSMTEFPGYKFFYDDGAIFKNANDSFMISAGPQGNKGLAAIKFTWKF